MRENSPLMWKTSCGATRVCEGVAGSKSQRTVGLESLLRFSSEAGGASSGGKKKKTLPSATVRSKMMWPSAFS